MENQISVSLGAFSVSLCSAASASFASMVQGLCAQGVPGPGVWGQIPSSTPSPGWDRG